VTNNPNIITEAHEPLDILSRVYHIRTYEPEIEGIDQRTEKMIVANAQHAYATYNRTCELLETLGHPQAIKHLAVKLVPRYGRGKIKLRDEKIGGVPDLRTYLYAKPTKTGLYNLERIWPRCGACHEPMKFVGQFNLLPWLLPIHATFGVLGDTSVNSTQEYAITSTFGHFRLMQHATIFADRMLHTFMCPVGGQHFDNPGFDSQTFVSNTYRKEPGHEDRRKLTPENEARYLKSLPKFRRSRYDFKLAPRKIVGWDFKLTLDEYTCGDWKADRALDEGLKAYPDVVERFSSKLSLLGQPRSQQTPRRFYSSNSYNGPQRLTPFLSFNDEVADFTYQIYNDFRYSDGFLYYGKIDGSCT
jgi:hypothetical protein